MDSLLASQLTTLSQSAHLLAFAILGICVLWLILLLVTRGKL